MSGMAIGFIIYLGIGIVMSIDNTKRIIKNNKLNWRMVGKLTAKEIMISIICVIFAWPLFLTVMGD